MPTYLYECEAHGEFEEIHSITEKLEECPKCKAEGRLNSKLNRLITGGNFILSSGGVGWYKEGYSGK